MSNPVTPQPPVFPEKASESLTATYALPHVLKAVDSQSGRDVLTVINGGNQQVSMLAEHWLSDEEVASPALFVIQGRNQISFAGQAISVINDAVTFNGKTLAASNPTATEYFAQVGKPVFTSFKCSLVDPNSAVGRTYRGQKFNNSTKPLYVIRQTSFIMP